MIVNDDILRNSVRLWALVSEFKYPADAVLSKFFRDNRKLKPYERNTLAETVYVLLRNYNKISAVVNPTHNLQMVVYTWLHFMKVDKQLLANLSIVNLDDVTNYAKPNFEILELPQWIVEHLATYMTNDEIKALDHAMNGVAPLTLRVNTLKANRDDLINKLRADGIDAVKTKFSPYGITLSNKTALMNNKLFLDGYFEVQDEASQLAGLLFDAKRGEMIVDFCAGSGGKTLMIGMMMRSSGRIYAFDVNQRRLDNMAPRLARSGLSNVYPQVINNENDTKVKRLMGKIDRVFVDAPCLGLGTLRRNPDLKFRQNELALKEIIEKQLAILNSASRLVKPKGTLLYATCSILREENREIIEKFLVNHPEFKIVNLEHMVNDYSLELADSRYLELLPHKHNMDGFFACLLQKDV